MAYQTIGTYIVQDWEQEEIVDKQLIADPDTGIVTEVETFRQAYARVWTELVIEQETFPSINKSEFKATLTVHATAGKRGDGFKILCSMGTNKSKPTNYGSYVCISDKYYSNDRKYSGYTVYYDTYYTVKPGETKSINVNTLDTSLERTWLINSFDYNDFSKISGMHYMDGSFWGIYFDGSLNDDYVYKDDFVFKGKIYAHITGLLQDTGKEEGAIVTKTISETFSQYPTALSLIRGVTPKTASNFTDEENPSFTYALESNASIVAYKRSGGTAYALLTDNVTSFQAALSLDGETLDVGYRDIPLNSTSYTFALTEAEREVLREKAQGSSTVPIYYLLKIQYESSIDPSKYEITTTTFANCETSTQRALTIIGCNPSLNPTVKDIKLETLALTGDENTFVRYESMAEYAINATASKSATIVSQSVTCGSKTISNLPNGVIDDVESGTFNFYVTDSRGMGASSSVFKNLVEYVKPTCYQKTEIEISGETGANIKLTINGNYFNDSFGAANNTLLLEVRYTDDDGNMGEWQTLTGAPTFNGNTYKLEATFGGFNYGKGYVFQCRATDKLNVVESSQYTIRMLPVFDWSENDFNFNVPVNIDAEDLKMHGETIIRHSDTTNNTVLSASGGHIYIRPGGTNDTSGQTILYSSGNVDFSGTVNFGSTVNFNNSFTIGGYILNDYVIETGSEAMGSNGTWYWRKWASGKAECWGCRNYGNMAVTTAWGNLYRSAIFTQDLPEDVFARTPDSININIVHGGYGGWICKHEQTAPSAITTGSFIYVRPASATVTPSNLGFHIIGEWK